MPVTLQTTGQMKVLTVKLAMAQATRHDTILYKKENDHGKQKLKILNDNYPTKWPMSGNQSIVKITIADASM